MQKQLYTQQVQTGKRTYTLSINQSSKGHNSISITQTKQNANGQLTQQKIKLLKKDIESFTEAFIDVLQKV